MAIPAVNIRHRGQMTLRADIRPESGVKDGGRLLPERREHEWVFVRADDLVDRTAGTLAEDVSNIPPLTPDELRGAAAQAIAAENLETLREIERDRENR